MKKILSFLLCLCDVFRVLINSLVLIQICNFKRPPLIFLDLVIFADSETTTSAPHVLHFRLRVNKVSETFRIQKK